MFVYDDLFSKKEMEKLELKWIEPKDADIIFDAFALKLDKRVESRLLQKQNYGYVEGR